jgi:aminodeoxyfutalosine synthase
MTRLQIHRLEENRLLDLHDRIVVGRRLSDRDALLLYRVRDLGILGFLASIVRKRKHGDRAYYILNRHLNYSNLCVHACRFCSFSRKRGEQEVSELTLKEMVQRVKSARSAGVTEIHIVGGLHPSWKLPFFEEMLMALKTVDRHLHLKAFTAIEILHMARRSRLPVRTVLDRLRAAGLDSLPGGGAEIFDPRVRNRICRDKATADEWLDVHRTWHRMGGRSTCTMLYGHVETIPQRVAHLRRLRELQDETGGFLAFVPLPFQPADDIFPKVPAPTGFENLRNLAIARLYLDNIEHLKCYWVAHGLKTAQVSLDYGVDDLDGTIVEEKIYHMAGARTPQQVTARELIRLIREARRQPVQRDSFYRPVKESRE